MALLPFPDPNEFSQEARDDADGPENSTVIMDPPIRTYEGHTDGVYKVSFTKVNLAFFAKIQNEQVKLRFYNFLPQSMLT